MLRLSCALAGDLQYILSSPTYCHVLDTFSFTPGQKCLCGRDFDATGNASTHPAAPVPASTTGTTNATPGGESGGYKSGSAGGGGGAATTADATATAAGAGNVRGGGDGGGSSTQPRQEGQAQRLDVRVSEGLRGGLGGDPKETELPHGPCAAVPASRKRQGGERRASGGEHFGDVEGGRGGLDHAHGFRVRPTLYQASKCCDKFERETAYPLAC